MSEYEWLDYFGENLLYLLRRAHITQRELARLSGISEAAISTYIHGQKMPGPRALVNIAHVMGCTLDELMDFGEMIEG